MKTAWNISYPALSQAGCIRVALESIIGLCPPAAASDTAGALNCLHSGACTARRVVMINLKDESLTTADSRELGKRLETCQGAVDRHSMCTAWRHSAGWSCSSTGSWNTGTAVQAGVSDPGSPAGPVGADDLVPSSITSTFMMVPFPSPNRSRERR